MAARIKYYESDDDMYRSINLEDMLYECIDIYIDSKNKRAKEGLLNIISWMFPKTEKVQYYMLKGKPQVVRNMIAARKYSSNWTPKDIKNNLLKMRKNIAILYLEAWNTKSQTMNPIFYDEIKFLTDEDYYMRLTMMYNRFYKYYSDKWVYKLNKLNNDYCCEFVKMPEHIKRVYIID